MFIATDYNSYEICYFILRQGRAACYSRCTIDYSDRMSHLGGCNITVVLHVICNNDM